MPESQTAAVEENLAPAGVDVNVETSSSSEPQDTGSENKSTLDAVKMALGVPGKSPTLENGQEPKVAAVQEVANPEAVAKAAEDIWLKSLSKDGQNRFRELANGNRTLTEKLTALEPKAKEFEQIQTVLDQHQLSKDDLNSGVEIMALIRTNPVEALNRLSPIVKNLLKHAGYELPDDLKADVEAGAISKQRAQELASQRMQNERMQGRQELQTQQSQQRQQQEVVNSAVSAADEWVAEKRTSDPDWHLKQDRVNDLVKLHMLETKKFPANRKEARDLFEEKLKAVEKDLKRFTPKLAAAREVTGNASPAAKPKPESTLDVIRQTLSGNR